MNKCHGSISSIPCNGAGDCRCGKCFCDQNFEGTHCECNRNECGVNGDCKNGKCIRDIMSNGVCHMSCDCDEGFTIDRDNGQCTCSTKNNECGSDGKCGGKKQGLCDCNDCKCNTIVVDTNDNDVVEKEIGDFSKMDKCNSIDPICAEITSLELGVDLKCLLEYCKSNPSEACFKNAENEEICNINNGKYYSKTILDDSYSLGNNLA